MVERGSSKNQIQDVVLTLHIKTLQLKVTQQTPIFVIWQRGQKKAKTNGRLLNESISQAVIDEKFQIRTNIEVTEEGLPLKPKMSKLYLVTKNQNEGHLAEADLDLSSFPEDGQFKYRKLPLKRCEDPDGYLEVGIQGKEDNRNLSQKSSNLSHNSSKMSERSKEKSKSPTNENKSNPLTHIIGEIEKFKKLQKVQQYEYEHKISNLSKKVTALQAGLESAKTDLAFVHRQKKVATQDKEITEKEFLLVKKKHDYEASKVEEQNKLVQELRDQLHQLEEKEDQLFLEKKEMEQLSEKEQSSSEVQISASRSEMKKMMHYSRFDFDSYLSDVVVFLKDASTQYLYKSSSISPRGSQGELKYFLKKSDS